MYVDVNYVAGCRYYNHDQWLTRVNDTIQNRPQWCRWIYLSAKFWVPVFLYIYPFESYFQCLIFLCNCWQIVSILLYLSRCDYVIRKMWTLLQFESYTPFDEIYISATRYWCLLTFSQLKVPWYHLVLVRPALQLMTNYSRKDYFLNYRL